MPRISPGARLQIDFILLSLVLFKASCFLTVLLDSLQSLSPSLPLSPFEERNTLLIKREREKDLREGQLNGGHSPGLQAAAL